MHVLRVPQGILQMLQRRVRNEAPRECVGLLFGKPFVVTRSVDLRNIASNPATRFFADPLEILNALREADSQGDTWLAVYHSHPRGPAALSQDDLAYAQPGIVQVLLTPEVVRAFTVVDGVAREIGLGFD